MKYWDAYATWKVSELHQVWPIIRLKMKDLKVSLIRFIIFLQNPVAAFEPGPRRLLILSYRAADGTLLGELVDNSPHAMHITEPLDGTYTAMYGSRDFIVPEDILNNKDGTLRCDIYTYCYV